MGAYKQEPRYNVVSTRLNDKTAGQLTRIARGRNLSLARLLSQIADEYVEASR